MTFQFESFEAFMAMEGHGPYVWACYAMVFFLFAVLVWNSVAGTSKFKKQQRTMLQRQAQLKDSDSEEAANASS